MYKDNALKRSNKRVLNARFKPYTKAACGHYDIGNNDGTKKEKCTNCIMKGHA